ncbi:unnamed protein product [Meloidogyne enterolobii]|uniref:Uncharacterized protein n=1 Tax=Meloidogyne enterolobii TaxID=390850 RepID=A0ACB0XNE0_MELEN
MIKRISHPIIRQFNASAKALFQHENVLPSSSQNVAKTNTKFINKTSLPDSIERDCQKWESALKKDMESKMESRQWLDLNLKCLDVISHNRSSKLVISTENISKNLTSSQKNDLSQILKVNSSIYLQIPNFSSDNCEHFISPGIVVSVFNGGFSVYFNQPIDDSTPFLNKTVQIQLSGTKTNISQLEFLSIRDTWHSLPGYDLLLYAYKCNKREQGNRLVDSLKFIEGEDLEAIEERLAFAAALNLQRKLVSIHIGGQTRTRMVAKYLDIITKKGSPKFFYLRLHNISLKNPFNNQKRDSYFQNSNIKIAIISPQVDQLYLMSRYHEMSGKTNFVSIQKLDLKLLQNIVKNPDTRALIERKSVEPGKGLLVEKAVNQGDNIVFIGHSNSLLKIFISSKIVFDVVILDGAERRSEIGSWQPILSLVIFKTFKIQDRLD